MNDPSLIRIHRLQRYRSSGLSYLISNASGQVFQSFFSPVPVIFCIQFNPDISLSSLIYYKTGKILERIQSLSSLSDKDAHIFSLKIYVQVSFFVLVLHLDLNLKAHSIEHSCKEFHCLFLDLGNFFLCSYKNFSLFSGLLLRLLLCGRSFLRLFLNFYRIFFSVLFFDFFLMFPLLLFFLFFNSQGFFCFLFFFFGRG